MTARHYEERLEADLDAIAKSVRDAAADVRNAAESALQALLTNDLALASETIIGDNVINRAIERIDGQCHAFVARHLPSAGHLRYISSVLRVNICLERIGDYAVIICREAVQLSKRPRVELRRRIEEMGQDAIGMFTSAARAFQEKNVERARMVAGEAERVERAFQAAFDTLVKEGKKGGVAPRDLLATIAILNKIERISDLSKNICEYVVFAGTGETKTRGPVDVLFLEKKDDLRSQMAVAVARKVFSNSGDFSSAGTRPAGKVKPAIVDFLEQRSVPVSDEPASCSDWSRDDWGQFDVIVSLDRPIGKYLDKVPFQTAVLEWETPSPASEDEGAEVWYEALHEFLLGKITDLMITLRGNDAE